MTNLDFEWPSKVNHVPKELYTRPDLYEREIQRIFRGPEWHAIAHQCEVPGNGDFKTLTYAEMPFLVARGSDGEVRVFLNSCPHRANQVEVRCKGNTTRFNCPYHRWTFANDGRLIGCPSDDDYEPGFDRTDYPLPRVRHEMMHGIIFITFSSEVGGLPEYLGDVAPFIAQAMGGDSNLKLLGYQKVRYACNWKVYGDNDIFHPPLLHRALSMLNWQSAAGERASCPVRGHLALKAELTPPPNNGTLKDMSIIREVGNDETSSCAVILFPLFVITKHLSVINLRFASPVGPNQTEVNYAYFARCDDDEETVIHRTRQGSNLLGPVGLISMEDAAIFQRTQIGAGTPGNMVFQKGVASLGTQGQEPPFSNEVHILSRIRYYREVMGM